jgi:hypothetical protein
MFRPICVLLRSLTAKSSRSGILCSALMRKGAAAVEPCFPGGTEINTAASWSIPGEDAPRPQQSQQRLDQEQGALITSWVIFSRSTTTSMIKSTYLRMKTVSPDSTTWRSDEVRAVGG